MIVIMMVRLHALEKRVQYLHGSEDPENSHSASHLRIEQAVKLVRRVTVTVICTKMM
jgi:hypothetical protein